MQPEKLGIWDRLFNRYRREIVKQGAETWIHHRNSIAMYEYNRNFVIYKVIDRVTGSERIEKEYLN